MVFTLCQCLLINHVASDKQTDVSIFRWFASGGINPEDPHNPEDNQEIYLMVFFRDKVGGALGKAWVKALVLTLFVGYVVAACFGVTQIKEGLEKRNTANFDSYSVQYYDREEQYFKKYAYTISLVFSGPNLGEIF